MLMCMLLRSNTLPVVYKITLQKQKRMTKLQDSTSIARAL